MLGGASPNSFSLTHDKKRQQDTHLAARGSAQFRVLHAACLPPAHLRLEMLDNQTFCVE